MDTAATTKMSLAHVAAKVLPPGASCVLYAPDVRPTLAVSSRGERMRASGLLHCDVRRASLHSESVVWQTPHADHPLPFAHARIE